MTASRPQHRTAAFCRSAVRTITEFSMICVVLSSAAAQAQDSPVTGPETEKRFPKLTVPEGFRATLFACDPLVEYPSVIAIGPEAGTVFVAYDYMTGLGEEIIRRDEIRIVRDRNLDGYADESVLYAEGFNSIQGLAWRFGTLYVMHAPLLTMLSDTNGDGTADERRDLLQGLGLPPEENSNRLHCANGVVAGHDGWLYLALGDRGCDVLRPEGDRLVFREGGILRCRPDGSDLHVFSRGLRNIYDIALDDALNVFVRDNENDGGDFMIRVCQCLHGSDHGYPYLYREHPNEAMPPLADLGRGSSAGGTAYLEAAFPQEFRESLFFCEWGRAVVTYRMQRDGYGFAPLKEMEFAAGAADDPYGFKPTDLVVDRDGSLLISDWCDGQRPKRGRARIYRITYEGAQVSATSEERLSEDSPLDTMFKSLDSPGHHVRVEAQQLIESRGQSVLEPLRQALAEKQIGEIGRSHAVWILSRLGGEGSLPDLLHLAESDTAHRVRAQAVRAIADVADPVFVAHRLDAGRAEESLCLRLAELWDEGDPCVRLEVLAALARLRWSAAPKWLRDCDFASDPVIAHAAMQLLRRSDNWPAVLELLDVPPTAPVADLNLREVALRALADQADESVVDGLLTRLKQEQVPERRREYLDLLTRVCRKPAAWTYWGFRPPPRPADSVAWDRTESITATLADALSDPDFGVRAAVVQGTLREEIVIPIEPLARWLKEDHSATGVAAILAALNTLPAANVRTALEEIIASGSHTDQNRLSALNMLLRDLDAEGTERLRQSSDTIEDGPVLAAIIRELSRRSGENLSHLLVTKLASMNDDVRAAAAAALAERPVAEVTPHVAELLADRDLRVRLAGITLAGKLNVRETANDLLTAAENPDPRFRTAGLESLLLLEDSRAVSAALQALAFQESQIAGLAYLGQFGTTQDLTAVVKAANQNRSTDVSSTAVRSLLMWRDRAALSELDRAAVDQAIAQIHGASGLPIVWRVRGPLQPDAVHDLLFEAARSKENHSGFRDEQNWPRRLVSESEEIVRLDSESHMDQSVWLAVTDLMIEKPGVAEILAAANTSFSARLDGRLIFEHSQPVDSPQMEIRFDADLSEGTHRLVLELADRSKAEFRLRFRLKSSKAEHERLITLVLKETGNVDRGRELFLNAEKSQCIKCHRLGEQGGRIGPDLVGIGSRFSRIHLVESLLEPSRTITPSYETLVVGLVSGQVLTGVRTFENEQQLILGDNQGKLQEISQSDIEERQFQSRSTMPDGLEQRLTDTEFLDLMDFLSSQKKQQ